LTEKQQKLLPGKEDKERPCFILATMMKKLFNVIKGLAWHCKMQQRKLNLTLLDNGTLRNNFNSLFLFPHAKKTFQ